MRQEVPEGHPIPGPPTECRQHGLDRRVEIKAALFPEPERHGERGHDLRQRGKVVESIKGDGPALGRDLRITMRGLPAHNISSRNETNRAWEHTCADTIIDQILDHPDPVRIQARVSGRSQSERPCQRPAGRSVPLKIMMVTKLSVPR